MSNVFANRRAAGLCTRCGKRPPEAGKAGCRVCLDKVLARATAKRKTDGPLVTPFKFDFDLDPKCRFCKEVAMISIQRDADYAAYWCSICGAVVSAVRYPAETGPIPQPEQYCEMWTRPQCHRDFVAKGPEPGGQ